MFKRFVICCSVFFLMASLSFAQEPLDKISLDIKGMDIVEVLKMLAGKADLNLVIDKNVSGKATVFLKDVLPLRALETILASNNLAQEANEGITRIMTVSDYEQLHGVKYHDPYRMQRVHLKHLRPQEAANVLAQVKSSGGRIVVDEASASLILIDAARKNDEMREVIVKMDVPLQTEVFELNYAKGDKVLETLRDEVTPRLGQIKWDSRTNKLIVTDYPDKIQRIKGMVRGLDDRTREVVIDAKIVQVNLDDKTSMGIDWEYVLNKKIDAKGMFGQVISTTGHKWTIGKSEPSDPQDYKVVIEALRTMGETKILSSPQLTVTHNEEAKILVGSKQVYVTTSAVQGQTSTQTAESVNFVDVGVQLFVTPSITADGFISMKIRPEVSSVVQNYKTSAGNSIPIVETSEAQTTVLIADRSTIMIGGLMKEEKTKNINKIPLLGDIPYLGALFRNSVDQVKKTELAIFLTCRIMTFPEVSSKNN